MDYTGCLRPVCFFYASHSLQDAGEVSMHTRARVCVCCFCFLCVNVSACVSYPYHVHKDVCISSQWMGWMGWVHVLVYWALFTMRMGEKSRRMAWRRALVRS